MLQWMNTAPVPAKDGADYADVMTQHTINAGRMGVRQYGALVTTAQIALVLPKGFDKVQDWRDDVKFATQHKVFLACEVLGFTYETRFDAVHGRRYVLMVYPKAETREMHHLLRGAMFHPQD